MAVVAAGVADAPTFLLLPTYPPTFFYLWLISDKHIHFAQFPR